MNDNSSHPLCITLSVTDITVDDVDKLPWVGGGMMINVKEMSKFMLANP